MKQPAFFRKAMLAALCAAGTALAAAPGEPWPLTLSEAERLLVAKNREALAAKRGVEAAQADSLAAAQRPNPTLSINTTQINPSTGIGGGRFTDKRADTVIRIDQPIERGDKREYRISAAESGVLAAQAGFEDTLRQQRLALDAAYFDLKLAQETVRVSRENAALYDESTRAAELRLRAGDIPVMELNRLRVEALRAQNELEQALAQQKRAQLALAALIAEERKAQSLTAADPWPQAHALSMTSEEWLDSRPDVRAAAARFKQAQAAFELARSQATRDVTVGAQYERFPPDGRNMYGIGISVPLFLAHRYEGEIQRANTDRISAEEALEKARAQAVADHYRAQADYAAAAERLRRYRDDLLPHALKVADAAEFAHRNGALGLMDLIDARRVLHALKLEAEQAQADFARADAALRAAFSDEHGATP